jgi:hypothetical protein
MGPRGTDLDSEHVEPPEDTPDETSNRSADCALGSEWRGCQSNDQDFDSRMRSSRHADMSRHRYLHVYVFPI